MRFFSPFAVLGLLHVARGGELDAFAGDRARNAHQHLTGRSVPVVGASNSSALTSEIPNIFKREQERREQHARVLDNLDANKDDHIEHDEIIGSLAVHWKGEENTRRMLRAFGAPDLEHFMKRSSPEEDDRVPKETFANILEQRPLENPSYCPAIRTKVESCSTQAVLRCGAYLTAAESFCNAAAKNMIETCIMSESCDNICTCIAAVEDAAHGNGAIEHGGELVQVDNFNSAHYPESGLEPRQAEILVFVAMFIWALIDFLIGVSVAYLVANLVTSLTSANPWMDTPGIAAMNLNLRAVLSSTGVAVVRSLVAKHAIIRTEANVSSGIPARTISGMVARDAAPSVSGARACVQRLTLKDALVVYSTGLNLTIKTCLGSTWTKAHFSLARSVYAAVLAQATRLARRS
ncbi:hypothetical protein FRC08_010887 [Ceratobasidium sp. 394]|nr:hypothetical protein FRC08_010887 [Ceratobasidium sp. 394]